MSRMTLTQLKTAVRDFVGEFNVAPIPELYGVNNGKAIGTYVERAFHQYLKERYSYVPGSSAIGLDFPELQVDLKVTDAERPQSSSPFRDATQKVYGLGYNLLVFMYEKEDDYEARVARLNFRHVVFVACERTADYQTTSGLRGILDRNGNKDDIIGFLEERNLPLDEIGREALADRILLEPPEIGYLAVVNALQWRLLYGRLRNLAAEGTTRGVENLLV